MTAGGWGLGGEGLSKMEKGTHGHGQQGGDGWGEGGIRGPNGNGKNIIKIIYFKNSPWLVWLSGLNAGL